MTQTPSSSVPNLSGNVRGGLLDDPGPVDPATESTGAVLASDGRLNDTVEVDGPHEALGTPASGEPITTGAVLTDPAPDSAPAVDLPDGDEQTLLGWVAEPEDQADRQHRADALWASRQQEDGTYPEGLSNRLQAAVYQREVQVPEPETVEGTEPTSETTAASEPQPDAPADGDGAPTDPGAPEGTVTSTPPPTESAEERETPNGVPVQD